MQTAAEVVTAMFTVVMAICAVLTTCFAWRALSIWRTQKHGEYDIELARRIATAMYQWGAFARNWPSPMTIRELKNEEHRLWMVLIDGLIHAKIANWEGVENARNVLELCHFKYLSEFYNWARDYSESSVAPQIMRLWRNGEATSNGLPEGSYLDALKQASEGCDRLIEPYQSKKMEKVKEKSLRSLCDQWWSISGQIMDKIIGPRIDGTRVPLEEGAQAKKSKE